MICPAPSGFPGKEQLVSARRLTSSIPELVLAIDSLVTMTSHNIIRAERKILGVRERMEHWVKLISRRRKEGGE